MRAATPESFWRSASASLARRINLGWWLDTSTAWFMILAVAGPAAVLLVRWLQPGQLRVLWLALAGLALAGALAIWLLQRRRFESPEAARIRLEDALGLRSRLSAAAAGVGPWPEAPETITWPVRWRWQRPGGVLAFAALMFALAAWIPIAPRAEAAKRIIEKPSAVQDVEQWIRELRKEDAVDDKSAEETEKKIAELLKRPAENWYEHGSLEAAANLREQTAGELRELAENLADAQRAASALQAMGDAAPQAVKDSLAGGLEQAMSNLAGGGIKPNEQLLKQMQDLKGSELKGLSKEQMQKLAEQLKKNGDKLGQCLGQCQNFDPSGIPTVKPGGKEGKDGKDGDGDPGQGGINRGRGDAEMAFKKDETNLATKKTETLPMELDPERAAPGDMLAVSDGKHDVDPKAYQGPKQGGAIQNAGDGGSAVWQNSLTPAEREVLKRYFK